MSDLNARIDDHVNFTQGRTEGIRYYVQRVVSLAVSAYMGVTREIQLIQNKCSGIFIKGLKDRDIKMTVRKYEPHFLRDLI